jgi:very-short-patch-repair endonuclease
MFTGSLKDRAAKERVAKDAPRDLIAAEQALAELLASRELRGHALSRGCELGPYLIDYLFNERSLIVELAVPMHEPSLVARSAARTKFLGDMGYVVCSISPREILQHPRSVLTRLRALLER